MEQKIFQDIPEGDREKMLEANCIAPEEKDIPKYFSPEEITQMRADFAGNCITIRKATEKLNKAKDEWKTETKPASDANEYLMKNIRLGFQEVKQQIYPMPDYDSKMIGYYDNTGTLIESRRMKPEEMQLFIPK
jgi:hypothetical protein